MKLFTVQARWALMLAALALPAVAVPIVGAPGTVSVTGPPPPDVVPLSSPPQPSSKKHIAADDIALVIFKVRRSCIARSIKYPMSAP